MGAQVTWYNGSLSPVLEGAEVNGVWLHLRLSEDKVCRNNLPGGSEGGGGGGFGH